MAGEGLGLSGVEIADGEGGDAGRAGVVLAVVKALAGVVDDNRVLGLKERFVELLLGPLPASVQVALSSHGSG